MPDELVTIGVYFNMAEAVLAQGKIESEGIECELDKEDIAGSAFAMPAVPINLRVEKKDEEAARAILAEATSETIVDEETGEEFHQPQCPNCKSLDVLMETISTSQPVVYTTTSGSSFQTSAQDLDLWKCKDCNHEWIAKED